MTSRRRQYAVKLHEAAKARRQQNVAVLGQLIWENRDPDPAGSGYGLGNARAAQILGITGTPEHVATCIYDLMPGVRQWFRVHHPGFAVIRPGDGTFQVTQDPERISRPTLGRLKAASTKLKGASAEMQVWRENSIDPLQHRVAARTENVEMLLDSLVGSADQLESFTIPNASIEEAFA